MRSKEERKLLLHQRAQELKEKKERLERRLLGAAAVCLSVLCCFLIAAMGGLFHTVESSSVYGASLLSEAAGGYVVVGVGAFVLGTVVTILCIKLKKRMDQK